MALFLNRLRGSAITIRLTDYTQLPVWKGGRTTLSAAPLAVVDSREHACPRAQPAVHGKPPFVFRRHWNREPGLHKSLNDECPMTNYERNPKPECRNVLSCAIAGFVIRISSFVIRV